MSKVPLEEDAEEETHERFKIKKMSLSRCLILGFSFLFSLHLVCESLYLQLNYKLNIHDFNFFHCELFCCYIMIRFSLIYSCIICILFLLRDEKCFAII